MKKDIIIPHPMWNSNYCYDCGVDMTGVKSYWTKFIEIGNETYQVKICDKCSDPNNIGKKQIDQKDWFKNKLIEYGLFNKFCRRYKTTLNSNNYCFHNIHKRGHSFDILNYMKGENWNNFYMWSFTDGTIEFTRKFTYKQNINKKFGKSSLEYRILQMLIKNNFIIIKNDMPSDLNDDYYSRRVSFQLMRRDKHEEILTREREYERQMFMK